MTTLEEAGDSNNNTAHTNVEEKIGKPATVIYSKSRPYWKGRYSYRRIHGTPRQSSQEKSDSKMHQQENLSRSNSTGNVNDENMSKEDITENSEFDNHPIKEHNASE